MEELHRTHPMDTALKRQVLWYLYASFIALFIGTSFGPFQALEHARIDLYPFLRLNYYTGLTVHGVMNALVFTTFFISGLLTFLLVYGLQHPLYSLRLGWSAFWVMVVGVLLAAWSILSGNASVLYTFYAPMKAHPAFYIGLALVVVGTWLLSMNLFLTYRRWRRLNPGAMMPLLALGALVTFVMWDIASIGIAVEVVVLLIPFSLGWLNGIDPLLSRTLFWFTGHPLVYFWLLPAYLSWYALLPHQAGGRLFSEPLARLALLLFLPLSVPVGLHHQFTDPGVPEVWKGVHTFLTFAVAVPSLMTAFTVTASLEDAGRRRGGRGILGWIAKLPWGDPSVAAQLLAIILFAFGGISGIINASYTTNLLVHNTLWVPGHFHLTVATAVALSFMGIAYWLIPSLRGRALWSRRLGVVQAFLWFAGMAIMSRGMSWAGLLGAPRRTALGSAPYRLPEWNLPLSWAAVGGVLLGISAIFFFLNIALTVWRSREPVPLEVPLAKPRHEVERLPWWLDGLRPWIIAVGALIAVAYLPLLITLVAHATLQVPGVRVW
ncbi:MAG: cbb3-type cytochrome c oxidase subunit I [Armatimonadota bacterium]|nr:cbb3-type cytochrome c oxidase subunit I [Armatimonadota bacterium]